MARFIDRVVSNPGRVILTPTENENEYKMIRNEGDVLTEGTPLNAENLNGIEADVINRVNGALSQSEPALKTAGATWTAPANGILSGVCSYVSATTYCYIQDTTDNNKSVLRLYSLSSMQQSCGACGVVKGHTYRCSNVAATGGTITLNFVPFAW